MGARGWLRRKLQEQNEKAGKERNLRKAQKAAYDAAYRQARGTASIKASVAIGRREAIRDANRDAQRFARGGPSLGGNLKRAGNRFLDIAEGVNKNSGTPLIAVGGTGTRQKRSRRSQRSRPLIEW